MIGCMPTCATVKNAKLDVKLMETWRSACRNYRATWSLHCRSCRGWGLHTETYDPSAAGVSLSAGSMTDVSLCLGCLEEERCPRCHEDASYVDGVGAHLCETCGFEDGKTEGMPSEPQLSECNCWSLEDVSP